MIWQLRIGGVAERLEAKDQLKRYHDINDSQESTSEKMNELETGGPDWGWKIKM